MRDLGKILVYIHDQIPNGEDYEVLKAEVEDLRSSVAYASPELMKERWVHASYLVNVLCNEEYDKLAEWQKKIVDVWTDKVQLPA